MTIQQPAAAASESPLTATLARVAALSPYLGAQFQAELAPGWLRASDLLASSEPWLDAGLRHLMARYGLTDRKAAAMFLLSSYSWSVTAAAIGCYLLEGRVPTLALDRVAVQVNLDGDNQIRAALLDAGFAATQSALAADPDAARLVAGPDELRDLLRGEIERHMAAVIEVIAGGTRLGRRAQWNLVADNCARMFLWIGELVGEVERGCREALAVIKAPGSPLRPSHTDFLTLEHADRRQTFCIRGSCCMTYKIPGAEKCMTCPLIPREEQERRLLGWLAERAAARG